MGRQRSPNRDHALKLYIENDGKISSKEIAELLNEKLSNINTWRVQDKWSKRINKVGAPIGNKNAIANKGGGAPKGNINSFKYGKYTDRIPFSVKTIMEELDIDDPIERLWRNICLQEARMIHMQEIMHVEDKNDTTKKLKKKSSGKAGVSKEYEIQFAWDKEANLMNTQSKAMLVLAKLIKQYDEMVHANWDVATEEQKLRVARLKGQIETEKMKAW